MVAEVQLAAILHRIDYCGSWRLGRSYYVKTTDLVLTYLRLIMFILLLLVKRSLCEGKGQKRIYSI